MQIKRCATIVVIVLGVFTTSSAISQRHNTERVTSPSSEEQEALEVVAQRIAGYNSHDIDVFLSAHAENVKIYEFPERQIGVGRAHLKRIFGPQFERKQGHVEVIGQFSIDNRVVSRESVTVDQVIERLVTIYTVDNGVITSFRLIESRE